MSPKWQSARKFAGAAMVVLLAATASYEELARRPGPDTFSEVAGRFAELKTDLPSHGVVCYVTDMDVRQAGGMSRWYLAEYSLAPVVLRAGTDCDRAVGEFADPFGAAARIRAMGFEIERSYHPDLMLLRRKRP